MATRYVKKNRVSPAGYKGILLEPMQPSWSEMFYSEWIGKNEWKKRVDALFTHYGISREKPEAWKHLAIALAMKHVPAFETRSEGRGRKSAIRDKSALDLVEAIDALRDEGKSIAAAAQILSRKWKVGQASTLARQYKRLVQKRPKDGDKLWKLSLSGYFPEVFIPEEYLEKIGRK